MFMSCASYKFTFPVSLCTVQGAVSLKHLGGLKAPKVVYFVLEKELLNLSETAPRTSGVLVCFYVVRLFFVVVFCVP